MIDRLARLAGLPWRKPPAVGQTPSDVVLREGHMRLLRYRPRVAGPAFATPVLLVPSLINRHYVLDLLPGKSFVEHLIAEGHDVYLIDWGTPDAGDRYTTFDDVCDRLLGRALRRVARGAPHGKAHLFGYCMGGTLTAIHAAAHPEHVATLTALAAPIAFRDEGLLSAWTRAGGFDVGALVDAFGLVPWQLMQGAFHLLRPTLTLSKLVHLADKAGKDWSDDFVDGFLALETWGNDNVSLPGELYRRYVGELYQKDALVSGGFALSGRPVDLGRITCPTLCVTFEHDGIVPWRSAAVLLERVGTPPAQREHVHVPGGHVGGMVARSAARTLWPRMRAFLAAHDGAPAQATPAPSPPPGREPGRRSRRT